MKKIKRGHIFMLLGALLIFFAVGLAVNNHLDDKKAGEQAASAYRMLYDVIDENVKNATANPVKNEIGLDTEVPEQQEMRTETIDGIEYVGVVSIPAMKVELPVQSSCDDDKLRYSPCRYKGNTFDGSLIIAAHNYTTHFGRLNTLQAGDEVTFTDLDGMNYNYKVVDIYNIDSTDIKSMEEQGDWDLTLFTCTYGNRQRVTVRCIRTN